MLASVFAVSATFVLTNKWVDGELKRIPPPAGFIREFTETERYKLFLYTTVLQQGFSYSDFTLLRRIIRCESNWQHYRKDGSVVIASGNIGLGQINKLAHEATYRSLKLDVEKPYDNIRFTVFLYTRDGVGPWAEWSGSCWKL